MKKILLILCALVCGTLAFAQTGTYTDWLHVVAGNDDAGVQKSDVAVEWTDEENRVIDFVLKDFSISISMSGTLTEIPLGDVTMLGINVGDTENGVATISCTEDHEVSFTDQTYKSLVSDISVNMTGDISETKLHAYMEIAVSIVIFGDYTVTATFGYDYGEYLIVNAENGNYFGGGLDYGTHATETDKPQFFTFIQESDGTYLINGHQAKSTSLGLDEAKESYYIDAVNPLTWELVAADDGSGYYIGDDDGYLTGNGIYEAATTESQKANATVWKLVTMEDVLATMDGASISNPVDVTPLIPAPEPKYNSYKDSWTATGYNETAVPNNYCFGGDAGWNASTPLCESYHSSNGFDVRQAISSLPAGYYELTAQGFYRNDGGTVIPSMYITTGTNATDGGYIEKVNLPEHNTTSDDMNSAYEEFLEGLYPVSLPFIVDNADDEFTVGFESNVEADDAMWSIFGELSLFYLGTELPELTAVTGTMNVDVEAAMTAAITAYNNSKTSTSFIAAEQAINDAEESVAHYAELAAAIESEEYEEVLSTFDDAGQAAFQSDFLDAYTNRTLTNETIEDGLAAACKKQTTEGSDMSYALKNSGEWVNAIGASSFQLCPQLSTAHEIWSSSAWTLGRDVLEKEAIYKQIEDLPEGTYTLSFYAYGSESQDANTRPLAYATGAEEDQEVAYLADLGSAWTAASLYTFVCEVGEDGILQFGMKTQGDGNWYVMEEYSLTLGEVESEEEDPYIYDITSLLKNPSFEEVDVDGLTIDTTRGTEEGGAWSVSSLTGWTLAAPTGGYAVSDLMSADATSTDNNFGVPGSPSDETYMLYLRNSHLSYEGTGTSASVMQEVTLPAGEYKLTVDSKCVASGSAGTVSLVAGEDSKSITIHSTSNGSEETKNNAFLNAWDTATLTFSLTETTEVTLGVSIAYDTSNDVALSVLLDNFQLFSTEEVEAVEYANDVTWALANPSFEVDNVVANLTADETRGSYKVMSLTGWDLTAPTTGYGISDLMTKEAKETDNNFGVPGEPSDGTYMLYLRDAHAEQNENHLDDASVMQTITLPAGDYKLTVDGKCVATSTAAGKVTLVAGEHSKALTIHVTENGSDDTASNPFLASWDTASLTFSLDDETEVTVGVNIEFTDGSTNYPLSVLLDNFKLYSVEEIEKEISWTMTDAGWGTMILPFAATLEDGLTAYSCDGTTTDEENETTTVDLTEVGQSIAANTPYIIKCTDDSAIKAHSFTGTPTNTVETYTDGILTGTLVDLAVAKGAAFATDGTMYLLQNHEDEDVAFYPIIAATEDADNSKDATLDAYHCYLDLSLVTTSARPVALHFPGSGEATAIEAVEGETLANDAIYDLSGRRVSKAVKGVYIQNGKKVLVK